VIRAAHATRLAALLGVVGVLGTAGFAYAGVRVIGNSNGGTITNQESNSPQVLRQLPETPVMLLVQLGGVAEDGDRPVTGLTLLSLSPLVKDPTTGQKDSRGGYVVDIPITIDVQQGDLTTGALGRVYTIEGLEALEQAVGTALQIEVDGVQVVTDADLAKTLAPMGNLRVDFADAVPDPDDGDRALFRPGAQDLTPEQVAQLLTLPELSAKPDASQRQRTQLWSLVLDKFSDLAVPPADPKATGVQVSSYLSRIGAGPHVSRSLSINLVAKGTSQQKLLFDHEVRALLAKAIPGKISVAGGARVWVINPLTDPLMSKDAAQVLLSGFVDADMVMLTDTAGTEQQKGIPEKTLYLYSSEIGQRAAAGLSDVLIGGQAGPDKNPVEDIDLTIVLGKDFEARVLADRAAAPDATSEAGVSGPARDANRPQDNAPVEGTKKKKSSGNG
jgi:hypothetical protein